ncbi:MAG: hypothetical protein E7655_02575 [Ruminococcaceae bacterium]|nr:hypothetical protein [Oscillospiraceae bacterium]
MKTSEILLKDILLPVGTSSAEALAEGEKRLKKRIPKSAYSGLSIFRRSVDSRKGRELRLVYSVRAVIDSRFAEEKTLSALNAILLPSEELVIDFGKEKSEAPPTVVGFGPAGMFAALLLAENGYRPLVLERGDSVEARREKVECFYRTRILDEESNIQYGAGGAGTFSDGKLVTRVNDPRNRYILRRLTEFGAPQEILTEAKPHIGTDKLLGVVKHIENRIEACGGRILYRTRLEGFDDHTLYTSNGSFARGPLLLAIGNSAFDTAEMLMKQGFTAEAKPISAGFRIEHLQSDIERDLYGEHAGDPSLPRASYSLSHRVGDRTAYSFCMCPGGEVVAATSSRGQVAVNGMSRFARDGVNANAAILATLQPADFSFDILKMIDFRRQLEKTAFACGGGDYSAPITTVGTYLDPTKAVRPGRVLPSYMGGNACREADFEPLLPKALHECIKGGLAGFARTMPSFRMPDAILTGTETRTSAPWRFKRDEETMLALGQNAVYPCGEGAGYAGGITSAALDGLKTALAVMKRYCPYEAKSESD